MRSVLSRVFILGLASAMLLCCNQRGSETMSALRHADDIIEDLPDSAYAMLQRIDATTLAGGKEQAYYSLLMSMAIDKQYIDLTADSVIAPAAKYYRHHGSNDDKMRTAYYHARILENAGDEEGAMKLLVDNLKLARKSQYHLFKGRYYIKIAVLYNNNYDFEHAYNYAKEAKDEYHLSGRVKNYVTGLLTTSTYLQQLKNYRAAEAELDTVKMYWNQINDHRKGEYYRQRINIDILFKGGTGASFREECIKEGLKEDEIPYIAISDSYLQEGMVDDADYALKTYANLHQEKVNTQFFQYQLSIISLAKEDYTSAFKAEKSYRAIGEHDQLRIINSDTRFIEERHESREKRRQDILLIVSLVVVLATIVACAYCITNRLKRKKQRVESLYESLNQEKQQLEKILEQNSHFDYDNRAVISSRLKIINDVLVSGAMGDKSVFKESEDKLRRISQDSTEVLITTAALFACSHPELISYLKSKGLTSKECGYCCLFILGLSGKEINTSFFNGSSAYKFSSGIRAKLGLDVHDNNLGRHLSEIASSLEKN